MMLVFSSSYRESRAIVRDLLGSLFMGDYLCWFCLIGHDCEDSRTGESTFVLRAPVLNTEHSHSHRIQMTCVLGIKDVGEIDHREKPTPTFALNIAHSPL